MRMLSFPELKERKGIRFCRMHIDRIEKAGNFPKRVRLSSAAVAWSEDEVDAWLKAKLAARNDAA